MDIFGDDIDSFLEAGELNENIRETDIDENEENENGDENGDEDGKGEPKTVEPKKRSARRPQVCIQKLREATDCAPTSFTGGLTVALLRKSNVSLIVLSSANVP